MFGPFKSTESESVYWIRILSQVWSKLAVMLYNHFAPLTLHPGRKSSGLLPYCRCRSFSRLPRLKQQPSFCYCIIRSTASNHHPNMTSADGISSLADRQKVLVRPNLIHSVSSWMTWKTFCRQGAVWEKCQLDVWCAGMSSNLAMWLHGAVSI